MAQRGGERRARDGAQEAHGGWGEGARVAMEGRGLAWYLRDARFHRKPSCEIWPSGCTQAQRGVSSGGGSDGWLQGWLMDGRAQKWRERCRGGWVVWQGCPRAPAAAKEM